MATDLDYVLNPDTPGLTGYVAAADPTGNNQPTVELVGKNAQGEVVHSGGFIQRHGGGGLRIVRGTPGANAASVFEIASDGKIAVV